MTDTDNATAGSERELVLTRLIDAPREKLFKAWTDPELLMQMTKIDIAALEQAQNDA